MRVADKGLKVDQKIQLILGFENNVSACKTRYSPAPFPLFCAMFDQKALCMINKESIHYPWYFYVIYNLKLGNIRMEIIKTSKQKLKPSKSTTK